MNHFSIARYIPADMSDYEAQPSEEQEHQLDAIAAAQKAMTECYRIVNLIPMDHGWPDIIRETLDGISALQAELENAQSDIFDDVNSRDDIYEMSQLRNDERRGDE